MNKHKIYLIPGTMCNQQLWSALLQHLVVLTGDCYDFVHIKIPKNKSFSDISAHLNDYFTEEQVSIIGFSLGGYIATHFATTFPQRVKSVFVIANSPCALYPAEQQQRRQIIEFVSRYGYQGLSRTRAMQLLDHKNTNSLQLDSSIDIMLNMDAELGEEAFISQMHFTSERVDLFAAIVSLQMKSVFYYSEDDLLVNSAWLSRLHKQSANGKVITTSGASHMLPLEKPAELAKHIQNWLNSI